MKKAFFSTEYRIRTKRHYPAQELCELLKENFGDRFGTIYAQKELKILEYIYIEGDMGSVGIYSSESLRGRGVISVTPGGPLKKQLTSKKMLFLIFCIFTIGIVWVVSKIIFFFTGIFGLDGSKKDRAMMKTIAAEIDKLVSK